MASNKQQIEIEEQQSIGACVIPGDSTQCSICMAPLKDDSALNKCNQCVKKMNSVPAGFPFETAGQDRKEFECAICLCIIRNATELPCEHLMCKECLEHYEKEQISQAERDGKNKEAEFFCSVCITKYDVNSKTPVKSVDRMTQTTVSVKCLQKECDWIGCIKDYVGHEKKCSFVVVHCSYFDLGCLTNLQRGKLDEHNLEEKPRHDSLLLNTISSFTKENIDFKQKIADQDLQIERLERDFKQKIADQDLQIGRLERDNLELKKQVQVQESNIQENTKNIERVEEEKSHLNRYINEQKHVIKDLKEQLDTLQTQNGGVIERLGEVLDENAALRKEVSNLNTFAGQMSQLHKTLSHLGLYNDCEEYLYEGYNEIDHISKWHDFVDEISCPENRETECVYLKGLEEAVANYQQTVYPKKWKQRLFMRWRNMPYAFRTNNEIKLIVGRAIKLKVQVLKIHSDFLKETKDVKWYKYSTSMAICRDHQKKSLHMILFNPIGWERIWIFDWSKVENRVQIPEGQVFNMDENHYQGGRVIIRLER